MGYRNIGSSQCHVTIANMSSLPILCFAKFDKIVEMASLIHYAESCHTRPQLRRAMSNLIARSRSPSLPHYAKSHADAVTPFILHRRTGTNRDLMHMLKEGGHIEREQRRGKPKQSLFYSKIGQSRSTSFAVRERNTVRMRET